MAPFTVVRTPGFPPWNQCLKSCFIIIWQLLAPFTSQPRVHKWASSTTGWVLMWNRDIGADTWCPALKPMSQIMFYNHLATFGTIYKSAKGPQVGLFHNGMGPDVERGQWCGHLVSGHGTKKSTKIGEANGMPILPIVPTQVTLKGNVGSLDAPRTAHLFTIYKSAKGPQVGRFHNGTGPDVERGQWCGHLVSGHGTNVSNHVL